MTPKEKAENLIDRVSEFSDYETLNDKIPQIELALICINEIEKSKSTDDTSYQDDDGKWHDWHGFWSSVKSELEAMR